MKTIQQMVMECGGHASALAARSHASRRGDGDGPAWLGRGKAEAWLPHSTGEREKRKHGFRSPLVYCLMSIVYGLFLSLPLRADTVTTWDFTNAVPYDYYSVNDSTIIEVDPAAPGFVQLILQGADVYHTTTNEYFGTDSMSSEIVLGIPSFVTLRQTGPNQFAQSGSYISRIFEATPGNRWRYMVFSAARNEHVTDPSLLAWYRMDNDNWLEQVSRTYAFATNVQFTADAKAGGFAGDFGGGLRLSYLQDSRDYLFWEKTKVSVAAWIKIRSFRPGSMIFSTYSTTRGLYLYEPYGGANSGALRYGTTDGSAAWIPPGTLQLNQWYFIVGTWSTADDTGKAKIYLDGNFVASGTSQATSISSTKPLEIGKLSGSTATSWYFDGIIDEVAVWNRALTSNEVAKLYKGYYELYPLRFQVRAGMSEADVETRDFVGSDGTTNSYYLAEHSAFAYSSDFADTNRFAQYKVDFVSSTDQTVAPVVGAVGLYGSTSLELDVNTVDFDQGDYGSDTVRGGTGTAADGFVGLGRSKTGGYFTNGVFTSRIVTNLVGGVPTSTTWDEMEWVRAGEPLDADYASPADMLKIAGYYPGVWSDLSLQGHGGDADAGVSSLDSAKLGAVSSVFDGSSDAYVDNFGYGTQKVYTIEFWLKVEDQHAPLMTLKTAGGTQALVVTNRMVAALGFSNSSYPRIYVNGNSATPLLHNNWNHVAVSWPVGTTIPQLTVGRVGTQYLRGMIDDMAVWAREVGQAEIIEHYTRGAAEIGGKLSFFVRASDDPTFGNDTEPFVNAVPDNLNVSGRYFQYRVELESTGETTPGLISVLVRYDGLLKTHRDNRSEHFYAGSLSDERLNPLYYGEAVRLRDLSALGTPNARELDYETAPSGIWHLDGIYKNEKSAVPAAPENNPGFSTDAKVGSFASAFNGVNQLVNLNNTQVDGNRFSFGLWFRSDTTNRCGIASTFTGGQTRYFRLELNDDGTGVRTDGTVALVFTDGAPERRMVSRRRHLNDGRWHHALIIRNDNQMLLYIDGILEAVDNIGSAVGIIDDASIRLAYSAASGYMFGLVDEVVLFGDALTPGEIGRVSGAGWSSLAKADQISYMTGGKVDNIDPAIWETLAWSPDGMYGSTVPGDEELVAGRWSLDETAGDALDSSINGNDGAVTGTRNQPGRFGNSIYFDGSGGVEISTTVGLEPLDDMAVSAWVYADEAGSEMVVFDKSGGGNGYTLGLDADLKPYFEVNGVRATALLPLRTKTWHHLTGVMTPNPENEVRIYVNGDMAGRDAVGGGLAHGGGTAWIGRATGGLNFAGRIDEAVVFDRMLTPTEILDHYRAGVVTLKFQAEISDPIPPTGFMGPGKLSTTYFRDWHGTDIKGAGDNWLGQYFQYKAYLATEDHRYGPTLRGISIYVSGYPTARPYVWTLDSAAQYFPGRLVGFSHNRVPGDPTTGIRYQVTGEQGADPTWYFWDTTTPTNRWLSEAEGIAQSYANVDNTAAEIAAGIGKFYDQLYDKTGGHFRFRAFLESLGDYQVQLDKVNLTAVDGGLTVLFPNGEETGVKHLLPGIEYAITWTNNGTVGNVDILLMSSNGLSQVRSIATDVANTGVYTSVIHNAVGFYRIKIQANADSARIYDLSDGAFQIRERMRLISPDGGEDVKAGDTLSVEIAMPDPNPITSQIDIWFSTNGTADASTWTMIDGGLNVTVQPGYNQHLWDVPKNDERFIGENAYMAAVLNGAEHPPSAQALNLPNDFSNDGFLMRGIAISYPLQTWKPGYPTGIKTGNSMEMNYYCAGVGASGVRIALSNENGFAWIATNAPGVAGFNAHDVVITGQTENARLYVESLDHPEINVWSDPFTIANIDIIAPIGGPSDVRDLWQLDYSYDVKWISSGAGPKVNVEYSYQGDTNWYPIAMNHDNFNVISNIVTNSVEWTVDALPSDVVELRVLDVDAPDLYAVTDYFSTPGLKMISPLGATNIWNYTSVNTVRWISYGILNNIDVSISYGAGPWQYVASRNPLLQKIDLPASTLPYPGPECRIQIHIDGVSGSTTNTLTGNSMTDQSTVQFPVRGLKVNSPTNDAIYTIGETRALAWWAAQVNDPDTFADVFYAADGVTFDTRIQDVIGGNLNFKSIDYGSGFLNNHQWVIQRHFKPSTTAKIRVVNGVFTAYSPEFTLRGIRITSPSASELVDINSTYRVRWDNAGLPSAARAAAALSIDGGAFVGAGTGLVTTNISVVVAYSDWNVSPELMPTTNAVLRLKVYSPVEDNDVEAYSAPFTLRGIKMLEPDTNSVWALGDTVTIRYAAAGLGDGAKATIYYSPDGAFDAEDLAVPIAQNLNIDAGINTYDWTIENSSALSRMPSTNGYIRVVSGVHQGNSQPFTLQGIKITRPTASDVWAVSDGTNTVEWVAVPAAGLFDLSFTILAGTNPPYPQTEMIVTNISGTEHDWLMNSTALSPVGDQVMLTLSQGALEGYSEVFEIVQEPNIRIFYPKAGDYLKIGSSANIRWIRGGNMTNDFAIRFTSEADGVPVTLGTDGAFPLDSGMFSYMWNNINAALGPATISISNRVTASVNDTVTNVIIAPTFTFEPLDNNNIYALNQVTLEVTAYGSLSEVDLYYSLDADRAPDSWVRVNNDSIIVTPGVGRTYPWIPPDIKVPAAWLRLQDRSYRGQEFDASLPGPFDDYGPFPIKYYLVQWFVVNDETGDPLNRLSVSDSSGWSASGLSCLDAGNNPVTIPREYPYGFFDTVWMREFFSDKVDFQWFCASNQIRQVRMQKSEVEPDYRVMANFSYNTLATNFNIQSWLERGGQIMESPESCTIKIYDNAGLWIETNTTTVVSDGVFRQVWNVNDTAARLGRTFGNTEVFFARVEITFSGVKYSSGLTFQLRQVASEDLNLVVDEIGRSTSNILDRVDRVGDDVTNILGVATNTLGELRGFRIYAGQQFTNLTDMAVDTTNILGELRGDMITMTNVVVGGIAQLTNQIGIMYPAVTNMSAQVSGLNTNITAIRDDGISGLARILTRPTELQYGSTNAFLFKTRPNYDPSVVLLTVSNAAQGTVFGPAQMSEVLGGIYQRDLIANWGTNSYIITCSDPRASDRIVVKVAGDDIDSVAWTLRTVSNALSQVDTELALLRGDVFGLGTNMVRTTNMLTQLDLSVTQLRGDVFGISTNVIDTTNRLAQVDADLAQLSADVAGIAGADLSGVESSLSELTAAVQGVEGTDLTGIVGQLAVIENAIGAIEGADLSGVQGSLSRLAERFGSVDDSAAAGTVFGRLQQLSQQVQEVGDAQLAARNANSAKTSANAAASGIKKVQDLVEQRDMDGAMEALRGLRSAVLEMQSYVEQVPQAARMGNLYDQLQDAAANIDKLASSQGFDYLVNLEAPGAATGEVDGEAVEDPNEEIMRTLNRNVEEMRGSMLFMQKMLDEIKNKPVVEETWMSGE